MLRDKRRHCPCAAEVSSASRANVDELYKDFFRVLDLSVITICNVFHKAQDEIYELKWFIADFLNEDIGSAKVDSDAFDKGEHDLVCSKRSSVQLKRTRLINHL
ncbi:hypothetical protein NE237_027805 [Protea cynaroides]|uniref:Uncharacterized protein n=1 Tax=Protea cynaroides TaxID=273540 RepID=A0A9Q0JUQ5_9MAGN|nr:hypothetical protein NE237_027805 [Protea cynaroides]